MTNTEQDLDQPDSSKPIKDVATTIIASYKSLEAAIDHLATATQRDIQGGYKFQLWTPEPDDIEREWMPSKYLGALNHPWLSGISIDSAEAVTTAIKQIHFMDNQDKEVTLTFPGVVQCSPYTAMLVKAVNEAKANFKQVIQAAKKPEEESNGLSKSEIRKIFTIGGFGNISLKQAYRPILIMEQPSELVKARFFLKEKRSVTLVATSELINDLHKERAKTINSLVNIQIFQMKVVSESKVALSANKSSEVITANISTEKGKRIQVAAVLPIYIMQPAWQSFTLDFESLEKSIITGKHTAQSKRTLEAESLDHINIRGCTVRRKKASARC